jgi:hypothetical protein
MKQKAVDILQDNRLMAIATQRPDGWPLRDSLLQRYRTDIAAPVAVILDDVTAEFTAPALNSHKHPRSARQTCTAGRVA